MSSSQPPQVWALDEEHLQRLRRENPQQDFTGSLTIQRTNIKSYVLRLGKMNLRPKCCCC